MPRTYARQKIAPCTGGLFVSVHVWPPSFEVAVSAALFEAKSPPPTIPLRGSRKATEIAPALGELTSGVSYAFQLSPPSRVAKILAVVAPPVATQALFCPVLRCTFHLLQTRLHPSMRAAYWRRWT